MFDNFLQQNGKILYVPAWFTYFLSEYPCPNGYYCPAGTAGDSPDDTSAGLRCPRGNDIYTDSD